MNAELLTIDYAKFDQENSYEWKSGAEDNSCSSIEQHRKNGWASVTYGELQELLFLWPPRLAPSQENEPVTEGGLFLMRRRLGLTIESRLRDYGVALHLLNHPKIVPRYKHAPSEVIAYLVQLFGVNLQDGKGYGPERFFPKHVYLAGNPKEDTSIISLNHHELVEICWADENDDVDLDQHVMVARLTILGRAALVRECEMTAHHLPREGA
jgi:hypothetical protein